MTLVTNNESTNAAHPSFVSSSTSVLTDIHTTLCDLQQSLSESRKLERRLKLALGEETNRNSQLEDRLKRERSRNEKLLAVMKGVDSSTSTTTTPRATDSPPRFETLQECGHVLETISPVLMQYRYDELALSHKRCLKILSRKESLLKTTLGEKEEIQAKYDDLLVQYQRLQKKMEVLCCKYFTLQAKKTEEILQLRELLNYAIKLLFKARKGRRCIM